MLDILLYHRKHLRRLDADTVETRKLQILVEDRRQLVDQAIAYSNQLRAKLKLYYPQALRWLPDLHAPLAGEFLKRWPTLPLLQKARRETLETFFHQHNCRSEELIRKRLAEFPPAVVATTDAAIVDSSVAMLRALVELMAVLRAHIAALDREIAATAAVHPELPIVASLPGAGPVMVPRLIAALGTRRERFACASELSAATGIAPVKQASGQSEWIHFRWAPAKSMWAQAHYKEQIRKGKGHHAAVRALAFKWQRILFRCWKDRRPYDEQQYLAALRRRGSPYAQAAAWENILQRRTFLLTGVLR